MVQITDKANYDGKTPLVTAICQGHTAVGKLLLLHGANPHKADGNGVTPLHRAAVSGNGTLIRLLRERGADPNQKNRWGMTPLQEAIARGLTDIEKDYLIKILH